MNELEERIIGNRLCYRWDNKAVFTPYSQRELTKKLEERNISYKECCKQKESKTRAFKAGEMPREYLNYVYRRKTAEICIIPTAYSQVGDVQLCFSALKNVSDENWIGNKQLYADWEVLINDKWQPVGVKEK